MHLGLNSYLSVFKYSKLNIKTVYDVGACNGWWYSGVRPFLPEANFFLFEANPEYEEILKNRASQTERARANKDKDGMNTAITTMSETNGDKAAARALLIERGMSEADADRHMAGPRL